jgi:hypothetical protein
MTDSVANTGEQGRPPSRSRSWVGRPRPLVLIPAIYSSFAQPAPTDTFGIARRSPTAWILAIGVQMLWLFAHKPGYSPNGQAEVVINLS